MHYVKLLIYFELIVDFIDEIFCYIIFQHDKQASNKKNIVLILNHYFDARSIKTSCMSTVHRSRRIRIYHVLCVVIYLSSVGDDRWSESWLCYIIQTITIIPIIYVFSCLRWEYNKCINLTKNERERERESLFHTLILSKSESNLHGRTKKREIWTPMPMIFMHIGNLRFLQSIRRKECGQNDVVKAFY